MALSDTVFVDRMGKERPCPFYKTTTQYRRETHSKENKGENDVRNRNRGL